MKKSFLALLLVVVLLAVVFVGCDPVDTPDEEVVDEEEEVVDEEEAVDEEEEEKVLKFAINAEPESFDINKDFTPMVNTVTYGAFEPLVRMTEDGIQPGMAKDWDISDDGLTYTFYLREDAVWTDGEPVTAHEYRDGLIRMFDPDFPTHYGHLAFLFENGREYREGEAEAEDIGITVIDDHTIEYKLSEPLGHFMSWISWTGFKPVRIDMVEEHGEAYGGSADTMVYNGPFVIDEWRHEEVVHLSKNPDYWDADSIHLDRVEVHIVPDSSARASMFEVGDLHMVDLEAGQIEQFHDHPELHEFPSGAIWFLMFRLEDELENRDLLKALGHSLNRKDIAEQVLGGAALPATRYVANNIMMMGTDELFAEKYPDVGYYDESANIEKAEEHLDRALEDLGLDSVDELPTFDILADDRDQNRLMAEVFQDVWSSELGIDTEITVKPVRQKYDDERVGDYEINWTGWAPDANDPMGYLPAWETGSNYDNTLFSSEEFDSLLREINRTDDPEERGDLMAEAEQLLLEDGVFCPVIFDMNPYLLDDSVSGFQRLVANMHNNYIYADIE